MLNRIRVAYPSRFYCVVVQNTFPMLEALLKGGADVNLPNQAGFTPIQVALQSGWQGQQQITHTNIAHKCSHVTANL